MVAGGKTKKTNAPPRPRFALSIGVVGHRPNRLPREFEKLRQIRADVDRVLDELAKAAKRAHSDHRDLFAPGDETLTMVSALAEGADRIAAKVALGKGFELDVPIPFPREEYEKDFLVEDKSTEIAAHFKAERKASEALLEFKELVANARAVLELPGERSAENRAYEAAGLTVLGQSDIVLAVWDGGPSAGRGGTPEMIQTAIRTGIPVVLVDANGQDQPKIIWQGLAPASISLEEIHELPSNTLNELSKVVHSLVRAPSAAVESQNLIRHFQEERNQAPVRIEFPLLLAATCIRPLSRSDRKAPDPDALARQFAATAAPTSRPEQIEVLAAAYGWADALGVRFAQTFRSAVVMNFMVGAFAVVLAALSLVFPADWKWFFVLAEVACIVGVIVNTVIGSRREWLRRWLQPRELAERLRVALPLWALGTRPVSFAGEEPSWIGWYARALVRQAGLRSGSLIGDEWTTARDSLKQLLTHQSDYHSKTTVPRMRRLHHRLERIGELFFGLTLAIAVAYLIFVGYAWIQGNPLSPHADEIVRHGVAAVSAAFPAIATALYGIRVIGDFEGMAQRSERTDRALRKLIADMEIGPEDLIVLKARAREAADTMLGDVASWRPAAESRGLSIP